MKRILAILLTLPILFAACSKAQEQAATEPSTVPAIAQTTAPTETEPEETTPEVIFEAPLVSLSMPISAVDTLSDDGTLLCKHTTQSFSLILPNAEVAQMIENDFMVKTDSGNQSARIVYEAAQEDYNGQTDWMPYVYSNIYSPTRLDQNILSLYGSQLIFDGSAGYTSVNLSVTYDLVTGNPIEEITQLLVKDFSADTLCDLIYAQLASLAEEGLLYTDYQYTISDMFATNTPVKNWYLDSTGLCFYFMPYELAPHSVGTILTRIPYASLIGLLQDRFFPSETVEMPGAPVLSVYSEENAYSQISELTLTEEGETYVLHCDGALFDVKIDTLWSSTADEQSVTVFAGASLGYGDAVVIHCSREALAQLTLRYLADGQYQSAPLADYLQ